MMVTATRHVAHRQQLSLRDNEFLHLKRSAPENFSGLRPSDRAHSMSSEARSNEGVGPANQLSINLSGLLRNWARFGKQKGDQVIEVFDR